MTSNDLKSALEQCVRCGRCLSVCPVYGLTGWEGSAPRGKVALMRADLHGESGLADRMKDLLSHCVGCGACAEICASGVKTDELIQAGRSLALGEGGLARLQGMLGRDLLSRGPVARRLWQNRDVFLRRVPPDSGLNFRLPLPGFDPERWLPGPAERSFLETWEPAPSTGDGPTVALFVGCVANYLRPESARAAARLLQAAGARIVVPLDQVCCGKPAAGAGDLRTARYLAQKNMAVLNATAFDYVAAFCATCSHQLQTYPDLAGRVRDLSDLLVNVLKWKPAAPPGRPLRVFYHDPCHLRRKQGVYREPRDLIESLPGVELVGADQAPVCCGYGGVFNLWHYDMSRRLFERRAETILPHQPDLAVTSCSGCWLQFQDGIHRTGAPFQAQPLVELLAERALAGIACETSAGRKASDAPTSQIS
ncbi:MAG: (Fe-S)-binding protein [Proteobacteria bacterium]|nr:(Fe-S)-binding protein [Pseudomonadota bacterium]